MNRSQPIRVLHVDDDRSFADLVAQFLERESPRIDVTTATDAGEGLAVLAEADVDCIVSDYDMPGRNGIEFLEAVREDHPDLPFVLFTGKGSEEVASDAISAGVTDYLQKEGGTDQYAILANRVENAVDAARAEREHRRHLDAIQTAQEGISILDREGRFRFVNQAYADLYGYDPEEMLGEHWHLIYRDEDVAEMEEEVLPRVRERGQWHGTTTGLRADGSTFVEDHVLATTAGDELVCTVRDVTDRAERERTVERLHEATRDIIEATTAEAVTERAVQAARDVLDMPANAVHLYDPEQDALPPAAWTDDGEALVGDVPTIERGEGVAWRVFESGEFAVFDDVSADPDVYEAETRVRSELLLPLGDHGVFISGAAESGVFTEVDVALGRTLAAHVTAALDRIDREAELREERTVFEQAVDALDELFYVVGPDGTLQRWNDTVLAVSGYEEAELDGMPAVDLFPPEERDRIGEAISRTLAEGRVTVEAELATSEGDRLPYEFTGARLVDTDGDVVGLAGTGRDVSERLAHENRLRELHSFATDLVTCETAEEVCERTIAAAEAILEFDLSVVSLEADGHLPIVALSADVPPDGTEPMSVEEGLVGKAYRSGESLLVEEIDAHPDANPQGPYHAALSVPIGDHGVFQTVSETPGAFDERDLELAELLVNHAEQALTRLDRERELREQNERLDEFVSIVSHDLRNPLNVAQGRVDLLREDLGDDADVTDDLDALDRSHERMEALIEDLLALSRSGESALEVGPVDLSEAAAAAWSTVATDEAVLHAETDATVEADRFRLRQLLENLFRNSVEHGSTSPDSQARRDSVEHGSTSSRPAADDAEQAGASVTVTVGDLPDGFYVADDGHGIPPEEHETVFESGYSSRQDGTGFGLNIVATVASSHGWDVSVTEGEAGGARFEFTGVER